MNGKLKSGVLVLALAGLCATAHAQVAPVPLVTVDTVPGGTLLDSLVTPISTPTFSGTFRSAVYDGPAFGQDLDFYYQFTNSAQSSEPIGRIGIQSYDWFGASFGQTASAFGIFPAGERPAVSADRFGPNVPEESDLSVMSFNFRPEGETGGLLPGETSYTLWLHVGYGTNGYEAGLARIFGETATTLTPTFQPAVPEPGTQALIAAGLGLVGLAVRRRSKAQAARRT